ASSMTGFLRSAPCPQCRMTNPAASLACWACGQPLKAARAFHHLCPRCDHPLDEMLCSGTTAVETCLCCSGVWFEAGELSVLLQLGGDAVQDLERRLLISRRPSRTMAGVESVARCPGCHYEMQRKGFGSRSELQVDT